MQKSIQLRVLLWCWAVFVCALLLVFWTYNNRVSKGIIQESAPISEKDIDLVEWVLHKQSPYSAVETFQNDIRELGQRLGYRVTYVTTQGVIADSGIKPGDPMQDSALLDSPLYVARKSTPIAGVPDGIIRLTTDNVRVRQDLTDIRNILLIVFLVTLAGSGLVVFMLSRTMTGSIRTFSQLVQSIGEGDYSRRIHSFPVTEFRPLAGAVNAMADKIESHISIIRNQRDQLDAIFDSMTEGIMVLDSTGRIESYNQALVPMFPLVSEFVGRTPLEVTLEKDLQDMVDRAMAAPQEQGTASQTLELPGQRYFNVSLATSVTDGRIHFLLLCFHDISDLKRVERVLRDFVANASHQLRTPLTSIKGYAETLLSMPPDDGEHQRKFMEIIVRNSDHMNKVLTGMFKLTQSELAGTKLDGRPVKLREILDQALLHNVPQADEAGLSLRHGSLPDPELTVHGDVSALVQVFDNLLENAVKYSPDEGIVSMRCEVNDVTATICVRDQGPGVPIEDRTRIFERFYRVDKNAIDRNGSAGIGLAICKHIVQSFGGEIWADDAPDDGAEFCVRLRLV